MEGQRPSRSLEPTALSCRTSVCVAFDGGPMAGLVLQAPLGASAPSRWATAEMRWQSLTNSTVAEGSIAMAKDEQQPKAKKVSLYERRGETSRFIDAEINRDGDLVVSGQDVGKAPREFWGDADYEFWVHVRSEHKDDVLLALMEQLYDGNPSAVSDFREFLESRGIHCEFDTWV